MSLTTTITLSCDRCSAQHAAEYKDGEKIPAFSTPKGWVTISLFGGNNYHFCPRCGPHISVLVAPSGNYFIQFDPIVSPSSPPQPPAPPAPPVPSYLDLYVTTESIPRTAMSELSYGLEVSCHRTAGWRLWDHSQSPRNPRLVAGEFDANWIRLDVAGQVIVDTEHRTVTSG